MFTRVSEAIDDPLSPWSEATVNWNNRPASDTFFREFMAYPNEPVTFDVTALVRAAQTGDRKLSLRLNSIVNDDNSQITFASCENSNSLFRPQLVIVADHVLRVTSEHDLPGLLVPPPVPEAVTHLAARDDQRIVQKLAKPF